MGRLVVKGSVRHLDTVNRRSVGLEILGPTKKHGHGRSRDRGVLVKVFVRRNRDDGRHGTLV